MSTLHRGGVSVLPCHGPGNRSVSPVNRMKGTMVFKRFLIVSGILLLTGSGPGPTAGMTASSTAGSAAGATPGQTLLTIACPGVTVCYAGGDNGTILATRDGGASWQAQTS